MIEFYPEDELICLGADEGVDGPVLPPIDQASLFRKRTIEELLAELSAEHANAVYSRGTNPGVRILEDRLARLERGEACKSFSSGMGAVSAVLFGLLKRGDHILFVNDIYGPTIEFAERLEDYGVSHSRVFSADIAAIEQAMRDETKIVYFESPGSMLFRLAPIAAIAALTKSRGAISVIDNTVATPLLQKPIAMGVDLVIHSCSKYIGGHSDVVGGAVIGSEELIERIFYKAYMLLGAATAPMNAFLLLRGLMTLPARLARHHADAMALAQFLKTHKRVKRVHHPAFNEDDATLFAQQMRAHSGLFSIEIDAPSFGDVLERVNRLKLFGKAVSWGGVESLVITGRKKPATEKTRIPDSLIRLSVGLEGAGALTRDLEQALA
ncbi:MAG: aminotransferase class I/II-fold pyridoxal phosphate-dependent enzyme [Parvularculaceae bacterium]